MGVVLFWTVGLFMGSRGCEFYISVMYAGLPTLSSH